MWPSCGFKTASSFLDNAPHSCHIIVSNGLWLLGYKARRDPHKMFIWRKKTNKGHRIHKVKSNKMSQRIKILLFPIYMRLNMFRATHRPPIIFFFLRRYNFREVLTFSTSFFHLVRFFMQSFQFVIFILVISLFTSSSHLFLGLPSDRVSAGDHSYTFFYHAVIWHTMYVSEPS